MSAAALPSGEFDLLSDFRFFIFYLLPLSSLVSLHLHLLLHLLLGLLLPLPPILPCPLFLLSEDSVHSVVHVDQTGTGYKHNFEHLERHE